MILNLTKKFNGRERNKNKNLAINRIEKIYKQAFWRNFLFFKYQRGTFDDIFFKMELLRK